VSRLRRIHSRIAIGFKSRFHLRTSVRRFATWAIAMLTSPYPSVKFAFGEFVRLR
jgi:hypothetical protein